MYSSIERKMCKCGCGKNPTISYQGWNYACAPQDIKDKVGTKAKVAKRNKNNRNVLSRKLHIEQNQVNGVELQRWFEERRKEMQGTCVNCGGNTCKDDDVYYRYSIAHLLPKNLFRSVKTHKDNWLELCYFGKGCHPMLDNYMLDLTDLNCFDLVITKFVNIYPSIAKEERRRIPEILLNYIETEK